MSSLDAWIARQREISAARLLETMGTSVIKTRAPFGMTIVPVPGSVVASTRLASYDPEPDYFFHWYRDAAIIMDALRLLHLDGTVRNGAALFADFVRFNLSLTALDGRGQSLPQALPGFERFLRRDLASAHGMAIAAETRVNPDGTLDVTDWPRPQHDGPALRALTVMRWLEVVPLAEAEILLRADLDFVAGHARQPCFDIWEEGQGLNYYTLLVSARALAQGADRIQGDDPAFATRCRDQSHALLQMLNGYWRGGYYGAHQTESTKDMDISVILAALHGGGAGVHSPGDPRLTATLDRLATVFGHAYAINQARPGYAPAMGRYPGDSYYSGGAWYVATLGAAEFCYRAGDRARGDAFLETVRAFAPADGALAEQFDQNTGGPASCLQLGWSHAAFLSCVASR